MYKIMRLNFPDKNHLFIDLWDEITNSGAEIVLYFSQEKQCILAEFLLYQHSEIIDFKFIQNIYDYCLKTEVTDDDIKAIRLEQKASNQIKFPPYKHNKQNRHNYRYKP